MYEMESFDYTKLAANLMSGHGTLGAWPGTLYN